MRNVAVARSPDSLIESSPSGGMNSPVGRRRARIDGPQPAPETPCGCRAEQLTGPRRLQQGQLGRAMAVVQVAAEMRLKSTVPPTSTRPGRRSPRRAAPSPHRRFARAARTPGGAFAGL